MKSTVSSLKARLLHGKNSHQQKLSGGDGGNDRYDGQSPRNRRYSDDDLKDLKHNGCRVSRPKFLHTTSSYDDNYTTAGFGARDQHARDIHARPCPRSAARLMGLPDNILERIFLFVCPHAWDETYETQEQSSLVDACMLCDLRDLAHCLRACKRWRARGINVLYHSIRIDAVHYCELEGVLAEKRKRRTFFDKNGDPENTAEARLRLLCRTVRDDPTRLGVLVEFLKLPYTLRESALADVARTISVLPNLRYVDLPEGLFEDKPSFQTLRLEVEARCLNLRKMTYRHGSEQSLEHIAGGRVFARLEVLDLFQIQIDPTVLLHVLGALPNLRAVKVTDSNAVTDGILAHHGTEIPPFPALEELVLEGIPGVTAEGLLIYLNRLDTASRLKVLSLKDTGVQPSTLPALMQAAFSLEHLSLAESVTTALSITTPGFELPLLASSSLKTLHYEITSSQSADPYGHIAATYYQFLADSLLAGGLPSLSALYARDTAFSDTLRGVSRPISTFGSIPYAQRPSSSGSMSRTSALSPSSAFNGAHGKTNSVGNFLSPQYHPGHQKTRSLQPNVYHGLSPQMTSTTDPLPSPTFASRPARFSSNNPFGNSSLLEAHHNNNNPFDLPKPPSPPATARGLPRMLQVFTKGDDDLSWGMVKLSPSRSRATSINERVASVYINPPQASKTILTAAAGERPHSSYGLDSSTSGWDARAGVRRSILVENPEGGGFVALEDMGGDYDGAGETVGSNGGTEEWPCFVKVEEKGGRSAKMDLWR